MGWGCSVGCRVQGSKLGVSDFDLGQVFET